MPPALKARGFPPPWTVEDIGGCFVVKASNERQLLFIYYGGRCRPPIPRETIDPRCRTPDRGRHRQGAGATEKGVKPLPSSMAGAISGSVMLRGLEKANRA
jgi:hypothetical protein